MAAIMLSGRPAEIGFVVDPGDVALLILQYVLAKVGEESGQAEY